MRRQTILALGLALLVSPAWAKAAPTTTAFKIVNLVSNQSGKAKNVDPNLVNAWGLSQFGTGPIWVSDNSTGLSTLYAQGTGVVQSLVVTIPDGQPTGTVYAPFIGFQITQNGHTQDSEFIFDSSAGVLSGWNSTVNPTNAVIAVDNSKSGAQYTGLAIDTSAKLLFAANNAQNKVEVYDSSWNLKTTFTDTGLSGYDPYNVAIISGNVYVTFVNFGVGGGYVDVFSESGALQKQLVVNGKLNTPWGLTIAPSTFGTFANSLLVGNLGDGKVNAYDPGTGKYLGTLSNKKGKALHIDGLWSLDPVPSGKVTFSAGPNGYANGLLGMIEPVK